VKRWTFSREKVCTRVEQEDAKGSQTDKPANGKILREVVWSLRVETRGDVLSSLPARNQEKPNPGASLGDHQGHKTARVFAERVTNVKEPGLAYVAKAGNEGNRIRHQVFGGGN